MTAPGVPPVTGAAVNVQAVAPPLEVTFATRLSSRPSPSGDSLDELIEDDVIIGGIVSMVTA